jgi:hypothetical protein
MRPPRLAVIRRGLTMASQAPRQATLARESLRPDADFTVASVLRSSALRVKVAA